MFTGLVEGTVPLIEAKRIGPGLKLVVDAAPYATEVRIGDSIAINGCCLTVIDKKETQLAFEAGEETLNRTNLGKLLVGCSVNFERSLKVGDRMGGHFVTGHIDGPGTVIDRGDDGSWSRFSFSAEFELLQQMASKGSVTIDGVSLTLVDVDSEQFSVALIPHTLQVTTFGQLQRGSCVNIETDVLAKYVQRQLRERVK